MAYILACSPAIIYWLLAPEDGREERKPRNIPQHGISAAGTGLCRWSAMAELAVWQCLQPAHLCPECDWHLWFHHAGGENSKEYLLVPPNIYMEVLKQTLPSAIDLSPKGILWILNSSTAFTSCFNRFYIFVSFQTGKNFMIAIWKIYTFYDIMIIPITA